MNNLLKAAYQVLADVTAERLKPTVYRNLERCPLVQGKIPLTWSQPGNVGNDGGASTKAHGSFTWYRTELITVHPVAAFDNFFYLLTFPLPAELPTNLVLSFDNYSVTPETASGLQALECQLELRDGLNVYNMAWQLDQASKALRVFNYKPKAQGNWFKPDTPLPYPDVTQPLALKAEFRLDRQAEQVTHDTLWVNGEQHEVGVTQRAAAEQSSPELSVAFQVDPSGTAAVSTLLSNLSVAWL